MRFKHSFLRLIIKAVFEGENNLTTRQYSIFTQTTVDDYLYIYVISNLVIKEL